MLVVETEEMDLGNHSSKMLLSYCGFHGLHKLEFSLKMGV